jgi:hypothetical protein
MRKMAEVLAVADPDGSLGEDAYEVAHSWLMEGRWDVDAAVDAVDAIVA